MHWILLGMLCGCQYSIPRIEHHNFEKQLFVNQTYFDQVKILNPKI